MRWLSWLPLASALLIILSLVAAANINSTLMQHVMQTRFGADGVAILGAWSRMQSNALSEPKPAQLQEVNRFFNRNIRYTEDIQLWKKSDYWATPLETLGMRAGDCEDYAIAKYLTLLNLGVPVNQLRLIYVKAQIGGPQSKIFQAHMVLGYYSSANAVPQIMDSLISDILPANKRPDLHPVFSFNSEGLWIGNQQTNADPTARLSRWRDLLTRVQAEGFSLSSKNQAAASASKASSSNESLSSSSAESSAETSSNSSAVSSKETSTASTESSTESSNESSTESSTESATNSSSTSSSAPLDINKGQ